MNVTEFVIVVAAFAAVSVLGFWAHRWRRSSDVSLEQWALERAGLLRRKVEGRSHVCRIVPAPLAAADEWLKYYERFWRGQLRALEAVLEEEDRKGSR